MKLAERLTGKAFFNPKSPVDLSENWSGSPPEGDFHSNFRMSLI